MKERAPWFDRALRCLSPIYVLALAACSVGALPDEDAASSSEVSEELSVSSSGLRPTADVTSEDVVGVGDTTRLWANVDDVSSDDSATYVRSATGVARATHTVGYAGGPTGTVTQVKVSYRAMRGNARGTAQVLLYDGATLVGTGRVNTLGSWANYSDTFTGLTVASASTLRTKVVLSNTAGKGAPRYTQIFLDVATAPAPAPAPEPPPDGELSFPIRAAFYYPWFPETWGNLSAPYTHHRPSAGYYRSDDVDIIQGHIRAMEYGKIQAAISSWWGVGHYTDTRLGKILETSAATGSFRWGVYYEEESIGNPTVAKLTSDLQHIASVHGRHPSFLRVSGKPVVFVFTDGSDGCSMADRWKQANAGGLAYVVLKVFAGYASCASQPDAWHQYGPAVAEHDFPDSFNISPGFWLATESTHARTSSQRRSFSGSSLRALASSPATRRRRA